MPGERSTEIELQGLAALLKGREERALLQKFLLNIFPTILQISLNIPGLPKRLEGDAFMIQKTESALLETGVRTLARVALKNAAGLCLLLSCEDSARAVKQTALSLEENLPWGRLLDLDVLTTAGPLSRGEFGLPPRSCLVCGNAAKACARSGRHGLEEVRAKIASFAWPPQSSARE